MANEVTVKEKAKEGIASYLAKAEVRESVINTLGKEHADVFISDVVACVQNNTTLASCTNRSIFSAALFSRTLNLTLAPQFGFAYLVPYDNKHNVDGKTVYVKEAVFQMGWKGYVQLALRSNNFRKIIVTDVRKGEVSGFNPFEDEYVINPIEFEKRTARDEKGNYLIPIVGYYTKIVMVNGFVKEMYMTHEEMLNYAKRYSKAYRNDLNKHTTYSFWTTSFEDMAKKTMLRQILGKYGLITTELQAAYAHDMAIEREDGSLDYIDNKPDDTEPVVNPFNKEEVIDAEAVELSEEAMNEADGVFK